MIQKLEEWRRRVGGAMPTIERQGINPFAVVEHLNLVYVTTVPFLAKSGYLSLVKDRFIIEVRSGLASVEAKRTEYHELAHFICVAHGRGARHHASWREIVAALGFPEEAKGNWPEEV